LSSAAAAVALVGALPVGKKMIITISNSTLLQ
jgi:hypothetical protein